MISIGVAIMIASAVVVSYVIYQNYYGPTDSVACSPSNRQFLASPNCPERAVFKKVTKCNMPPGTPLTNDVYRVMLQTVPGTGDLCSPCPERPMFASMLPPPTSGMTHKMFLDQMLSSPCSTIMSGGGGGGGGGPPVDLNCSPSFPVCHPDGSKCYDGYDIDNTAPAAGGKC